MKNIECKKVWEWTIIKVLVREGAQKKSRYESNKNVKA